MPMVIGCKLSKDGKYSLENQNLYRSMIGSMLYVSIYGPNIMQVTYIWLQDFKLH